MCDVTCTCSVHVWRDALPAGNNNNNSNNDSKQSQSPVLQSLSWRSACAPASSWASAAARPRRVRTRQRGSECGDARVHAARAAHHASSRPARSRRRRSARPATHRAATTAAEQAFGTRAPCLLIHACAEGPRCHAHDASHARSLAAQTPAMKTIACVWRLMCCTIMPSWRATARPTRPPRPARLAPRGVAAARVRFCSGEGGGMSAHACWSCPAVA